MTKTSETSETSEMIEAGEVDDASDISEISVLDEMHLVGFSTVCISKRAYKSRLTTLYTARYAQCSLYCAMQAASRRDELVYLASYSACCSQRCCNQKSPAAQS